MKWNKISEVKPKTGKEILLSDGKSYGISKLIVKPSGEYIQMGLGRLRSHPIYWSELLELPNENNR